jgi:hypothetical protein
MDNFDLKKYLVEGKLLKEYDNIGPSTPKIYLVKEDGTFEETSLKILSKISNLTYDMGGGETNYYPEKNIVIVDNIPVEEFAKSSGDIESEKVYVEYNLNKPYSFPKADKIIASQLIYHLDDPISFSKTVNTSLKENGKFQFFSDLMNNEDKKFLKYLSSEYGFGLPKSLPKFKGKPISLVRGEYKSPKEEKLTGKVIDKYGRINYYNDQGELHREDGPASITKGGGEFWFINGKLHREDGPAANWVVDGQKSFGWFLNNKEYTEEEFNKITNK